MNEQINKKKDKDYEMRSKKLLRNNWQQRE